MAKDPTYLHYHVVGGLSIGDSQQDGRVVVKQMGRTVIVEEGFHEQFKARRAQEIKDGKLVLDKDTLPTKAEAPVRPPATGSGQTGT